MTLQPSNYTRIPNVILDDWMSLLTGEQFKVLLCICRKTFGWHKNQDAISHTQIEKDTGISRMSVIRSVKTLIEYDLIEKTISVSEHGDSNPNLYRIKIIFGSTSQILPSIPQIPRGSIPQIPTKETLTKETLTKEKEASKGKEHAASLSMEQKIRKCRSIKAEDKEPAIAYFKSNPAKFEKADNPMALLITIVRAGDHLKKTRASLVNENKEWANREIAKTNLGEQFCIGKSSISVFMSQGMPDHVIKFDNPEFKKLILYRIKQRLCDTKISLLEEYI